MFKKGKSSLTTSILILKKWFSFTFGLKFHLNFTNYFQFCSDFGKILPKNQLKMPQKSSKLKTTFIVKTLRAQRKLFWKAIFHDGPGHGVWIQNKTYVQNVTLTASLPGYLQIIMILTRFAFLHVLTNNIPSMADKIYRVITQHHYFTENFKSSFAFIFISL